MQGELHLDYETFSMADLTKTGAYRYAADPSAEIVCLAYKVKGVHDYPKYWSPYYDKPIPNELLDSLADERILVIAHNAMFERAITKHVLVPQYGAVLPSVRRWRCTAAACAVANLPRALGDVMQVLYPGDERFHKDKRGTDLVRKFCIPKKLNKRNSRIRTMPHEAPNDFWALNEYCMQDVVTESLLWERIRNLVIPDEWEVFALDMEINERGLPLDAELVELAIPIVQELEARAVEAVQSLTDGIRPTQRQKMLEWLKSEEDIEIDDFKSKTIRRFLRDNPKVNPRVRDLLELRLETSRVSTKKLQSMSKAVMVDGTVKGTLLFYGASTGRWSGKVVQPHNFTRGTLKAKQQLEVLELLRHGNADIIEFLYDKPLQILSQCMRGFIRAPAGYEFVVADFSSIEARVLAWYARQEDMLERYRRNEDQYIAFAANHLYHISPEEVTSEQRRLAKNAVLGAGYSMGGPKFVLYCDNQDITITEEEGYRVINAYRSSVPMIVRFWRECENAVRHVLKTREDVVLRNLRFGYTGKLFTIWLASGRPLYYPGLRFHKEKGERTTLVYDTVRNVKKEDQRIPGVRWAPVSLYGGKIVENIVQATARDLLVHGLRNCEKNGYPVSGHVHDEALTLRPLGTGDHHELERIISKKPDWATDLPVGAEGFICVHYRK